MSAALGGAVGPGKALAGSVCQWQQQGKPGAELLKLDVNVVTTDRYNRAKSVTLGTVTPVGGLGEDAYFATIKAGQTSIATLNVKKGASAVIIRVCGKRPVEDYEAKEKVVAQALVPKL